MRSIAEADLGTPARPTPRRAVTLTIDGREVTVPAGTIVMRAAALAGIPIPKPVRDRSGSSRSAPAGSASSRSRACKGYPASCTTPVSAGMKVRTQSDGSPRLRRGVMELYVSDHPLDCLTCPANGHCELQDMAGAVGLREVRYGLAGANHLAAPKDDIAIPTSASILRAASSARAACAPATRQQGTFALTIEGARLRARASPRATGAFHRIRMRFLRRLRPGLSDRRAHGKVADRPRSGRAQRRPPPAPTAASAARSAPRCAGETVVRMVPRRGRRAPTTVTPASKGALRSAMPRTRTASRKPMIRAHITDPWREVSWDEAIAHAAAEFRRIQAKYGRDSVGGITSSRCTNEETFWCRSSCARRFGNNNVDTCARVCHSPTGYGLKQTLGESAGTQTFDSVMASRRDHGDRREPDRRASGVRLAAQAPAARRGAAHRRSIRGASTWCARRMSRPPTTCSCGPAPMSRSSTAWRTSS